jgi:protein gp37
MAPKRETRIRWARYTWNPMTGCTPVSPGCDHCYAKRMAETLDGPAFPKGFEPMFRPHKLTEPAKWPRGSQIFVCSMSDLFHRAFDHQRGLVFHTMVTVPHVYVLLTKRPERMEHYLKGWVKMHGLDAVPSHIWVGTSIESDAFTYRADVLRRIPAETRVISAEPLLGPLPSLNLEGIGWLIVGGESGPGYRAMNHAWAADLRDRALAAGTAFYFKQSAAIRTELGQLLEGQRWEQYPTIRPRTLL